MWKVKKFRVEADEVENVAKVFITYTNDIEEKEVMERISDPFSLKTIMDNGVNNLNNKERMKEFISNPPTLEEIFAVPETVVDEYAQKRQALIQAKQDLDLKLITDTDYTALVQETIATKTTQKTVAN